MKDDGGERIESSNVTPVRTWAACTTCFATWKRHPPSDSGPLSSMDDFSAFTEGERALLEALNRHGVRFMLVGLSAAALQGANTAPRDLDLCIDDTHDIPIYQAYRYA